MIESQHLIHNYYKLLQKFTCSHVFHLVLKFPSSNILDILATKKPRAIDVTYNITPATKQVAENIPRATKPWAIAEAPSYKASA